MGNVGQGFQPHRVVEAADVANPEGLVAEDSKAIDAFGNSEVLFGVSLSADGAATLTVQPLHYDPTYKKWYMNPDQAKTYNAVGDYVLPVESYGSHVWLKVTAITGTDAKAEIAYGKLRKRTFG